MNQTNTRLGESDLIFAPEGKSGNSTQQQNNWKILIVDDEPDIHEITEISLKGFTFDGRGLDFYRAYSASDALQILSDHPDIAIGLIDVVMEKEHAGLELIHDIRSKLKNAFIRLILRTGQPGQAPERKVIQEYDINDYKEKTELTSQKLFSSIYTSLRSYRDLIALNNNRLGLEHIIRSSAHMFTQSRISEFIQGVLQQLVALLYLDNDAFYMNCECLAFEHERGEAKVIAATGRYSDSIGRKPGDFLEDNIQKLLDEAHRNKKSILKENQFVGYFEPHPGREGIIYVNSHHPLNQGDLNLLDLFLHNVSVAYENLILRNEIEGTQREMLYMLGDSIETRSSETGQHVRRVAEYCRLIALGIGLQEQEAEIIEIASPLHDFGKIGIPDSILHKEDKLTAEEWRIMQSHARIGQELLQSSQRESLKAAAVIAGQHHEHWNGKGYPDGLMGEEIHLYARIAAVADVFDALGSKRCYKQAWPLEKIVELLRSERGQQFDPVIIDWVLGNIETMKQVRIRYPDHDEAN